MNQSPTPESSIRRIIDSGVTLPPLPAIGMQLMEIIRQPLEEIEIGRVTRLVEQDPSLTARILQVANSPYFGAASKVTGVRRSIALIGLQETINLLNLFVLQNTVINFPRIEGVTSADFWAQSWACASAARNFGQPQYLVGSNPGDLFLGGLFHYIGIIILAQRLPEEFQQCIQLTAEKHIPLHQAEDEILDFDHAMVGAEILTSWSLPENVRIAVYGSVDPDRVEEDSRELAGLVQLARLTTQQVGICLSIDTVQPEISDAWICRHGESVFTDTPQRSEIINQTAEKLRLQCSVILESESAAPDSLAQQIEEPPAPAPAAKTSAPAPRPTPGFAGRLANAFRALFGR